MTNPTILRARTPADLLAAVPCILGFQPEQSLVMLTFGGSSGAFHARVDLPDAPDHVSEVVGMLVSAAAHHQVPGVAIIAYTADAELACHAVDELVAALGAEGVDVAEQLRAHDHEYWPLWPELRDGAPARPFDPESHRFRAEAVVRGQVVHGSREELAATLEPAPSRAVAVAAKAAARRRGVQTVAEALWLHATVLRHARECTLPTPQEAGRLLADLARIDLRDVAWVAMDDTDPDDWLDLWSQLSRSAPKRLRPAPAALLAFAAWRAGHGALAWCAIDQCRDADPSYSMADRVADMLTGAVPPSAWPGFGAPDSQDGLA